MPLAPVREPLPAMWRAGAAARRAGGAAAALLALRGAEFRAEVLAEIPQANTLLVCVGFRPLCVCV